MASTPGILVDLQTNGRYRKRRRIKPGQPRMIDFSSRRLTKELVVEFLLDNLERGTVPCPTSITQKLSQGLRNLGLVADGLQEVCMKGRWQHAEWPFFSGKAGAIGAHPVQYCTGNGMADCSVLDQMVEASKGSLAVLTVGADVRGIARLIEKACVEYGLLVCLGHHIATQSQIDEAVSAGATFLTHLWNGMPKEILRQGFQDYQLRHQGLGATLISDRTHVTDANLDLTIAVKGVDKVIVLSDQGPPGSGPLTTDGQWLKLWTHPVRVQKHPNRQIDSRQIVGRNGYFAGSYADQFECARHLADLRVLWRDDEAAMNRSLTESDLWRMLVRNPLQALGKTLKDVRDLPVTEVYFAEDTFWLNA